MPCPTSVAFREVSVLIQVAFLLAYFNRYICLGQCTLGKQQIKIKENYNVNCRKIPSSSFYRDEIAY